MDKVVLIENIIYADNRGYFLESFNDKLFVKKVGCAFNFVQDNHSHSAKHVLRGIHYQKWPYEQGKLVRVTRGAAFDIAVDLRPKSLTFGKWVGYELREGDGKALWIPPGFGHAFLSLENDTDFLYKTTEYYHPGSEVTIAWNDPDIDIKWPTKDVVLSEKDKNSISLKEFV